MILHFYTSCHIKEKDVEFLLFETFCSLIRNENIKKPSFYTLQVTRIFLNFPQLKKQLEKTIRVNIVIFLNCDMLELEIRDS